MAVDIASVRASASKAALNPAYWAETLWQVSQLIDSDMALFEHIDKATGAIEHGFTDRPDLVATTRDAYEKHFYAINPRYDVARARPLHEITHDDLIGDERTIERHEFYGDFLRPCGLKYFIGTAAADDAETTVTFSIQRAADRGRVNDEGRRAFAAILPDIRNAMALYLRKVHAPCGATLAATLDRLADPLAVLRQDGRLVFANRAMAGLLAAGDIIRLHDHSLIGADEAIGRALGAAMRRALTHEGSAMAVAARPASHVPLILRIAPLARDEARHFAPAAEHLLCLLVDNPARSNWRAVEEAMRLFGLTRREANVGIHLGTGLTMDEIAARLGVSRNTVRTHGAMLRDKLGVRTSLAAAAQLRRATRTFA